MVGSGRGQAQSSRHHAFISYVREDSQRVDWLQSKLETAGVPVWRDTADLWPGQDWRHIIRRAIQDEALAFLACFSSRSLARPRSYQNEELLLAIEQFRMHQPEDPWLIPIRFSECAIPDLDIGTGRTLSWLHRVDLFGYGADDGADRLITTILRILGPTTGISVPAIPDGSDARLSGTDPTQGREGQVLRRRSGIDSADRPDSYQDEHEAWSREVIRLNPADATAHLSLGNALNNQGRLIEAEAALRKAIHLDPGNPDAHASLGTTLGNQGRLAESEAACREAIDLDPALARAYRALGCTLNNAGRLLESEAACRHAISLDPADAWSYIYLGAVLDRLRRFPEAEDASRAAIRLGAVSPYAYTTLGNVLSHLDKWEDAEKSYREAIRLDPASSHAYSGLGFALHKLGKSEEAQDCFHKAIRLNSEDIL
jgi:tetratricopeptide (TPR) repeat protein